MEALSAILAPDYQLVRNDASRATKDEYLAAPATVNEYSIANVKGTTTGNTLVVSFDLTIDEIIDGQTISSGPRRGWGPSPGTAKTGSCLMGELRGAAGDDAR